MGDNPLAKIHGLSPHTSGQTMIYILHDSKPIGAIRKRNGYYIIFLFLVSLKIKDFHILYQL